MSQQYPGARHSTDRPEGRAKGKERKGKENSDKRGLVRIKGKNAGQAWENYTHDIVLYTNHANLLALSTSFMLWGSKAELFNLSHIIYPLVH